jgi:hypothetical protein
MHVPFRDVNLNAVTAYRSSAVLCLGWLRWQLMSLSSFLKLIRLSQLWGVYDELIRSAEGSNHSVVSYCFSNFVT